MVNSKVGDVSYMLIKKIEKKYVAKTYRSRCPDLAL
jgi:hypothetical protein